MIITIRVGPDDFDAGAEQQRLHAPGVGAVASFTGLVRDFGDSADVVALELEHYPGMTEKSLHAIIAEAGQRWPLAAVTVIHRTGRMMLGDNIVLVAVASAHRAAAFAACEFIMDWLKTGAPFWKREIRADGQAHWVDAKASDDAATARWLA
ncbi:molybdopterin synthase catalytic subunit MoaE [Laribacter hongkongensis]|uniref:molybdopterin synthase catalytic subunit MoaE n=1 Tax=Laribacter hongkongensis TaxID=168471 RepID=UPI001EFEA50E|nr:molybdopterin synthase catalytic subunit MoaE [Laribacter hongkongensis]MCG9095220.1 molybdopterin synthase catalytic subunit MoaE [Laribacter hongkongensis]